MMRKRHNQVLVALLAVQIVLIALVFWPRPAALGREPLLPGFQAAEVTGLTVRDDKGNTVTVRKVDGNWVLPEADNYPAQSGKVEGLLTKLAALTNSRLVTRTAASHKQLQVAADAFQRQLDIESAGASPLRLYLGSPAGYGTTHIRLDGHDETYLGELTTTDLPPQISGWVDTVYLRVSPDTVSLLEVRNISGTLTFSRPITGTWSLDGLPAGETLDQTRVNNLLNQVATVRMLRPLGREDRPEYGMSQPLAVVTMQAEDRQITLTIGAQDPEDSSYVVRSSESPYYVRVAGSSLRNVVEKGRDFYLVPPPTPTPSPTPSAEPPATPGTTP